MDGRRFDELVTAFSRTASRRQLLRTFTVGIAAALCGRGRAVGAVAIPLPAQPAEVPIPNFPLLVALPTDPGLEQYEMDVNLTGPPTRFIDTNALPSLPDDWREMVSECRAAYVATIAQPKSDAPGQPQRSITTILFDLGTPANAEATHADYVDRLLKAATRQRLAASDLPASSRDRITLIGCEGGCVDLSSPADSGVAPSDEVAAVGVTDRFIFDARIREFGSESITSAQAATLSIGIDQRLGAVGTPGSSATSAKASSGALNQATPANAGSASFGRLLLMQSSSDDVRQTLASANTLPVFGVGEAEPPKTAVQWLRVDDGAIVVTFGQSAHSAAADQRDVNGVAFALSLEQPLPLSQPVRDGYDLILAASQYVFDGEEAARRFLAETQDRIARSRPQLTLTDAAEGQDERSYTYADDGYPDSAHGPAFGMLTHVFIPFGSLAAIVAVDVIAVPVSAGQGPIEASDLRRDVGPLVGQVASTLADCLVAPDTCPATAVLTVPPPIVPVATEPVPTEAAPTEAAPTATATNCPADTQRCGDLCVDTTSDPEHCGDCETVCDQGRICAESACTCDSGTIDCAETCVSLLADPNNCGRCGIVCPSDAVCADGGCRCPDQSPPCGQSCCAPGLICSNDACVEPCPPNQVQCGNACVDLISDPANCGSCGTVCRQPDCCGGKCVDVSSDRENCGACYNVCPSNNLCGEGLCSRVAA